MGKGYIFDLGRVLVNFDLDIAFKEFCKYSNQKLSIELVREKVFGSKYKHVIIDFELGLISSQEFYEKWSEILSLEIGFEDFKMIWGNVFNENTPMKKILNDIEDLPKIILSNIDPVHWEVVKEFEIVKNYFPDDSCIKSYEVNFRKPSREIFHMARKRLGNCSSIVYIDDIAEYGRVAAEFIDIIVPIQYDCRYHDLKDVYKENN